MLKVFTLHLLHVQLLAGLTNCVIIQQRKSKELGTNQLTAQKMRCWINELINTFVNSTFGFIRWGIPISQFLFHQIIGQVLWQEIFFGQVVDRLFDSKSHTHPNRPRDSLIDCLSSEWCRLGMLNEINPSHIKQHTQVRQF